MTTIEELAAQLATLQAQVNAITTPSHAAVVNKMSALTMNWQSYIDQQRNLIAGTAEYVAPVGSGQPAPGMYPLTDPAGVIHWVASEALRSANANKVVFERRILTAGSTHVGAVADSGKTLLLAGVAGTSSINYRVPTDAQVGWCTNIIQEGSGGARVTVTVANNTNPDGTTGDPKAFLRQRGNAFKLTNQWAMATILCYQRDSSNRPYFILSGDLTL